MKIVIGKLYKNQTWDYLYPCLTEHGQDFAKKVNGLFKLAIGIHDTLLDGSVEVDRKCLFIMFDSNYRKESFHFFLQWLKNQPFYVLDYPIDPDIRSGRKHMVVVTIPKKHWVSHDMFLQSRYSEMYTPEDVDRYFSGNPIIKNILNRTEGAKLDHIKKIETEYGESIPLNKFEGECDFPLKRNENIFNCKEQQRIFYNNKLDVIWGTEKEVMDGTK